MKTLCRQSLNSDFFRLQGLMDSDVLGSGFKLQMGVIFFQSELIFVLFGCNVRVDKGFSP
jgi:hypothetical protein